LHRASAQFVFRIRTPACHEQAAQHGVPADRCAHKIVGILTGFAVRLRRLNADPLGRTLASSDQAPCYSPHTTLMLVQRVQHIQPFCGTLSTI